MSTVNNGTSFHCDLTGGMVWSFPVIRSEKSESETEDNQSAVRNNSISFNAYKEFNKQLLQALRANPNILAK